MLESIALLVIGQTGTASARIVNATVDVEPAMTSVGGIAFGAMSYGARSQYLQVPAGKSSATLETVRGGRVANPVGIELQAGYPHTIVIAGKANATGQMRIFVLRDTTAGKPSMSSMQMCFVNAMSDSTTLSVKINGKDLKKPKQLPFGESSPLVNYTPREFELSIADSTGKALYTTQYKGAPGTRVTAIAMGAQGLSGNRAPRLFLYEF